MEKITNEEKAKEIVKSCMAWWEDADYTTKDIEDIMTNACQKIAEWKDEQFKNQEQTLLWTVEHMLDRLCVEGEAREIAIKEFTNDLQYYETEDDSKE